MNWLVRSALFLSLVSLLGACSTPGSRSPERSISYVTEKSGGPKLLHPDLGNDTSLWAKVILDEAFFPENSWSFGMLEGLLEAQIRLMGVREPATGQEVLFRGFLSDHPVEIAPLLQRYQPIRKDQIVEGKKTAMLYWFGPLGLAVPDGSTTITDVYLPGDMVRKGLYWAAKEARILANAQSPATETLAAMAGDYEVVMEGAPLLTFSILSVPSGSTAKKPIQANPANIKMMGAFSSCAVQQAALSNDTLLIRFARPRNEGPDAYRLFLTVRDGTVKAGNLTSTTISSWIKNVEVLRK